MSLGTSITWASTKQDEPTQGKTSNKVSSKIYFALANEYDLPLNNERKHFSCSDKVFSVVELNNLPKTKYKLSFTWIDPNGNERERTEFPFTVTQAKTRLWSWLSLSASDGASMIQWINPAAGLEEFIGLWNVEIRVNGREISTQSFEVIC